MKLSMMINYSGDFHADVAKVVERVFKKKKIVTKTGVMVNGHTPNDAGGTTVHYGDGESLEVRALPDVTRLDHGLLNDPAQRTNVWGFLGDGKGIFQQIGHFDRAAMQRAGVEF